MPFNCGFCARLHVFHGVGFFSFCDSKRGWLRLHPTIREDQPMKSHFRIKDEPKPPNSGFATPHVARLPKNKPDEAVNDSFGSVQPADTKDTEPDKTRRRDAKGAGKKRAG
jgi:hypothetical protein